MVLTLLLIEQCCGLVCLVCHLSFDIHLVFGFCHLTFFLVSWIPYNFLPSFIQVLFNTAITFE